MATILLVCTGNICRSPMAEGLLRRLLTQRQIEGIGVVSAGTWAHHGSSATPEAIQAVGERGIDISAHSARRLTPELIESADLVLAMAAEHRNEVIDLVPETEPRAFTLKEFVALVELAPEASAGALVELGPPEASAGALDERLRAAVARAHRLRSEHPPELYDEDIADPLGFGAQAYHAVASEMEDLLERLAHAVFGAGIDRPHDLLAAGERWSGGRRDEI